MEVPDDNYGIEVRGVDSMQLQGFGSKGALKRCKTEPVVPIGEQKKPDKPIAETANAVVEDQGFATEVHRSV